MTDSLSGSLPPNERSLAEAIGAVTMEFARLESIIDQLLIRKLGLDIDSGRVVCSAAGSFDRRCNLLSDLNRVSPAQGTAATIIETAVQYIQSDIIPGRNRLIHDPVLFSQEGAEREDRRGRFAKSGTGGKTLRDVEYAELAAADVHTLARRISALRLKLSWDLGPWLGG